MNGDLSFMPISPSHGSAAAEMVWQAYLAERSAVPILPEDDFHGVFQESATHLFQHGTGIATMANGRLVGFLAGYPVEHFFGSADGVYCPLFGHGVSPREQTGRSSLGMYRLLYQQAAALWTSQKRTSHAITVFAHDAVLVDGLFRLGFGMRCIDLIRESARLDMESPDAGRRNASPTSSISIRKSVPEDAEALASFRALQPSFYMSSPIFMPKPTKDPVQDHLDWLSGENQHEWTAWKDGQPVGLIRLAPHAETFVADHASVMNVQDTFVSEDLRGEGVGTLLLDAVQAWLLENGYPRCGVDCESINPSGSDFWLKHFTPYTWSLTRRVDERAGGSPN